MGNFKCKIMNYQRIESGTMEFVPGLNVIVGETNQGKSGSVRSLETAIYNIPREDHITLGKTKSAVGIQYNGHEVIWRRDKESASQVSYRIDGKIYQKLGRGQPKEVSEALGITELEINDKKFRLNFSKQMSYPFLLDSTPADMFKFIAQSSGEDNLIDVLKQMKKDVNEISSKVKSHEEAQKVLGESLVQLEKRYKEISKYGESCNEVIQLDSKVSKYEDLRDKIDVYLKCTNAVEKMNNSLNYYKSVYNDISSSVSVAESHMKKLNELDFILDRFYSLQHDQIQQRLDLTKYMGIVYKYKDLDSVYESFKSQEANNIKMSNIHHDLVWREQNILYLDNFEHEYEELKSELEKYNKYIEAIGKVLSIKDEKETQLDELQVALARYKSLIEDMFEIEATLSEKKVVVEECEQEISTIGVCPYCGSVLAGGNHGQCTD